MSNWFGRAFQFLMQSTTASYPTQPSGSGLAAIAIKSNTLDAVFDNTKPDVDYIQGTISACLNARASERGVLKFIVRDKGFETMRSKQLQRVLDKPNPVQSRTDFMETCSQFSDATGNAIILFVKGDMGLPAEMWCLPSFYCVALFDDPTNPVPTAYRWADGRVIGDTSSLCFIRQNSVKTAPYIGRGFLGDMLDTARLYDLVVKGQINWFATGGAPNVALVQPAGSILTCDQITDVQKQWHQKYNPATGTSNVAVLPDGVTPKDFGPQELNFNVSKDEIRDAIREALQTPKIILGDTDNVNHNNGQTALAMFERLVVLRWGQKCADALQHYFQTNVSTTITVALDPAVTSGFTQLPDQKTASVEREFPLPASQMETV